MTTTDSVQIPVYPDINRGPICVVCCRHFNSDVWLANNAYSRMLCSTTCARKYGDGRNPDEAALHMTSQFQEWVAGQSPTFDLSCLLWRFLARNLTCTCYPGEINSFGVVDTNTPPLQAEVQPPPLTTNIDTRIPTENQGSSVDHTIQPRGMFHPPQVTGSLAPHSVTSDLQGP